MWAASSASALRALAGSPDSRSRSVQKSVRRVRASFGLKFASEFKENGSARIETDSITTARVDVEDTLNNSGLLWVAPNALAKRPHRNAVKNVETKSLR